MEFIIEYVVTQVRVVRITANSHEEAANEVKEFHEQHNSEKLTESIILISNEEDK
jgi:hypothetical protein